jgi:hypothetical protein
MVSGLGPGEGFQVDVSRLDPARVSVSGWVALRCGPAQVAVGQPGERLFRQVGPAGAGGCEGQVEAGVV